MILVDTSIWIDHLHTANSALIGLLDSGQVLSHPLVVLELGAGSIARREQVLGYLAGLSQATCATHDEVLTLITSRALWGKGLSAVDLHLLASVLITPGAVVWTGDQALAKVARQLGVGWTPT